MESGERKSKGGSVATDSSQKRQLIPLAAWTAVIVVVGAGMYFFDVEIKPRGAPQATPVRESSSSNNASGPSAEQLAAAVIPEGGYTVDITWGDTGKKLVQAGGVDMEKYRENYSDPKYQDLLGYLTGPKDAGITITRDNAYFWVNTLWALGLTQKSDVLEEGIMGTQYKDELGNFASTGGWTLGTKDAVTLYSSTPIIALSKDQQALVTKISEGVYRPCCGNPTSFPDCNHGMAALGLIELMASQDFSEREIYDAVLAFNSYWFSQTYMELAYYFATQENTDWENVDPRRVLSADFSSAAGYGEVKKKIGNVPGLTQSGGSCGA